MLLSYVKFHISFLVNPAFKINHFDQKLVDDTKDCSKTEKKSIKFSNSTHLTVLVNSANFGRNNSSRIL